MQKFIKQNNLNYFDVFIIVVCITICMWAIAVKTKLINFDLGNQVSDALKVANLIELDGDVRVRKNNVFFWKDSFVNENLGQGESVFVGGSSEAAIEFINGDMVKIGENTIIRIKFDKASNVNQLELTQGNIQLKSKSDSELVINGMKIETKGDSDISINNTKSKLQFVSNKGEAVIGDLVLNEGTISDGKKITKAFYIHLVGGSSVTTTKVDTMIQAEFKGLDESIDEYRLYVTKRSNNSTEVVRFQDPSVRFKAKKGKYILYAEAYINGELVGLSPKVQFEVNQISRLRLRHPNPMDKYVYQEEGTPAKLVWNRTCDCIYKIKVLDNSDQSLVVEAETADLFYEFIPEFKAYKIELQALDKKDNIEVDSASYNFEFKSSNEFNPRLLFGFLKKTTIFLDKTIPFDLTTISDAKISKLRLVLSSKLDFSDAVEVPYTKKSFTFTKGGMYYVKAMWEYNNETIENVADFQLEVIDLKQILSPPKAVEDTQYRKIQSVEITATQTLKWSGTNSLHQTFYRIEIADNKAMKNAKVVETDVNTVDITLKETKQYWRIKKIVRIDNVLYEGSFSDVFEIKAYEPPEFVEEEGEAPVQEEGDSNRQVDPVSKPTSKPVEKIVTEAPVSEVAVPVVEDIPGEVEGQVSAKKQSRNEVEPPQATNGQEDDIDESEVEVTEVPEPEELDNFQRGTVDTTGGSNVGAINKTGSARSQGTKNSKVTSKKAVKKKSPVVKKRSVPLKRVAVPGAPGISIIQPEKEAQKKTPVRKARTTRSNTVSPSARSDGKTALSKSEENVDPILLNAPAQVSTDGVSVGGKPAPKIVFTPKENVDFKTNKVQIKVDNFDAQRIKYARFIFEKKSKTIPLKTGKLTLKADKMPSKSKIFLLDKRKKTVSSMNLDLEPFYKNGCRAPKYSVLKVNHFDDNAIIKIELQKGRQLFLNFKPAKLRKGLMRISLNKEYTLSLCVSKKVKLFKNQDLTRIKIARKAWRLRAGLSYNTLSLSQSGSSDSGSAFGFFAGAKYLIPESRLIYKGNLEFLSGNYDKAGSVSYSEIDNALLYNFMAKNYKLLAGPVVNMAMAQHVDDSDVLESKMINLFGGDITAIYDAKGYTLEGSLQMSVSPQSSTLFALNLILSREWKPGTYGQLFFQQKSLSISDSDLESATLSRTSLGIGLEYAF